MQRKLYADFMRATSEYKRKGHVAQFDKLKSSLATSDADLLKEIVNLLTVAGPTSLQATALSELQCKELQMVQTMLDPATSDNAKIDYCALEPSRFAVLQKWRKSSTIFVLAPFLGKDTVWTEVTTKEYIGGLSLLGGYPGVANLTMQPSVKSAVSDYCRIFDRKTVGWEGHI